jgi:hypothetical protein
MHKLRYRVEQVPDHIQAVARDATEHFGYDLFAEIPLGSSVQSIRWVSVDSVKEVYPEFLEPPYSFSADEIIRIDWLTWSVSRKFSRSLDQAVISRSESIIVAVSTLMEQEAFTYCLGPEFNWLEWEESDAIVADLPAFVVEELGKLIAGEWRDHVRELVDSDPNYIEGIHPALRPYMCQAAPNSLARQRHMVTDTGQLSEMREHPGLGAMVNGLAFRA